MNTEKKRGRPRLDLFPGLPSGLRAATSLRGTRRTGLNWDFLMFAQGVLAKDAAFDWVTGARRDADGAVTDVVGMQRGLLVELGRIAYAEGDEAMREAAAFVCEHKPHVKDGARALRRWRLGRSPEATVDGLRRELAKAIDAYRATHTGCTWELAASAVEGVLAAAMSLAVEGDSESASEMRADA
jgi:hypothetical protein